MPRRVVYDNNHTHEVSNNQKAFTSEYHNCECQKVRGGYHNNKYQDIEYAANDIDPRVQYYMDKMTQQIFELKNELDHERAKSRVLAEKVDHMMLVFGSLLRA